MMNDLLRVAGEIRSISFKLGLDDCRDLSETIDKLNEAAEDLEFLADEEADALAEERADEEDGL